MSAEPPAGGGPDDAPRRRRHRRATGGVPAQPDAPAGTGAVESVVPRRSADDEDTGWGETPSGNDERLLRDVPPHW